MKAERTNKKKDDIIKMYVKVGKIFKPMPYIITGSDKKNDSYWVAPYDIEAADKLGTYNNFFPVDRDSIGVSKKISHKEAQAICESIVGIDELPE